MTYPIDPSGENQEENSESSGSLGNHKDFSLQTFIVVALFFGLALFFGFFN